MKKVLFVSISVLLIVGFFAVPVVAGDSLARFEGGIGVIPSTGRPPNVVANTVRGVVPAGQIWVIRELDAKVDTNGDIKVEGKGLVLGGGDNAGRATGQRVFATLICEAAAPFTERSTDPEGVPLAANGDFRIDDVLTPPLDCASPMLLIRNAANLNWFAVGILKSETDD